MTRNEILARYPNASASFIRANLSDEAARPAAVVEPNPCHAPLATKEVQRPTGDRVLVRVTSVRKRLLDQDNLCEKYHVDLCRYAGVIPGDSPEQVEIEVHQRKTKKGEAEFVIVEVIE